MVPAKLIEEVKKGRVVLFLGSGALYGATLPERKIPLGNDLRDLICDEFLNDNFKSENLAHVAAMAISQTSLFKVQDFIKEYFDGLKPALFHEKLPLFKWRAIFTTNYDFLIELVYSQVDEKIQDINIILSNEDGIDETRVTTDKVPYLKLHGCVSRTHDSNLPLILTTDQYNDCRSRRNRLFNHLYELAYENTIIFVGHSLQDFNIRAVLLELQKEVPDGQRHYLLKPGLDDIEKDFWAEKKISALDVTFENFLNSLSENISEDERLLALVRPSIEHPIQSFFDSHIKPSSELVDFLTNKVELVTSNVSLTECDPTDFFKGMDQGWSSVANDVAIKRNLQKDIFESVIERPDADRSLNTDFYVIKGEAGAGKTVLLRQLAWEAKDVPLGIVLWVKSGCNADFDHINEIITKTNERVFLFWDDAAINAIELNRFMLKAQKHNTKVTIITAERYNEWNVRCEEIDQLVTGKYSLKYLSEKEIDLLVKQLEQYNSLGPNLINKSHEERCKELKDIHGRQLLVALHEATMGEPFEDIVYNEYVNVFPDSAQKIYLTVCTLNRLKIPVRAGLISRIHNISFIEFQKSFYKPLEKVVITRGATDQDIHYFARHSEIAEIVFRRALADVGDRYQEYIHILNKVNISFSSDRSSFRTMIRAKSLNELFPSYEDVDAIYKHTYSSIGDEPYLLQQMANYERIRSNGSLDKAITLLQKAKEEAPYDSSILHSLNVVWRDKAARSEDLHLKRKCRAEARTYLDLIVSKWGMSSYISSSQIELSLDSLKDLLSDEYSTEVSIRDSIRKVQLEITDNKQKYPSDGHLSSLEAQFADLINDHKRALKALEKSFEENDREPYLAIRLSNSYLDKGDTENANKILISALERRRADHRLNFHYAELQRRINSNDVDSLIYYYRRGFTPNDRNYHAQFWFARFAFNSVESNLHKQAVDIFENNRRARLSHANKNKIRDIDGGLESSKVYTGVIVKKRNSFGFIQVDGAGHEIFFPANSAEDGLWEAMVEGDRVKFFLGFAFSGPVACKVNEN